MRVMELGSIWTLMKLESNMSNRSDLATQAIETRLSDSGVSRRQFLSGTAGITFTLSLGSLAGCAEGERGGRIADGQREPVTLNAYINIAPDGVITIYTPSAEMGQGTWTSLPVVVAEELDADWSDVRIEASPSFGDAYGDPLFINMIFTAASRASPVYFDRLRRYGAQARQVLLSNAAEKLGVSPESLTTEASKVCHGESGRCLTYGEIAAFATLPAEMPALDSIPLKDPEDFRLIGRRVPRRDLPEKINGQAEFAIDVNFPNLLFAAVTRPPISGMTIVSVDDAGASKAEGVVGVLQTDSEVAVVARSYYQATSARERLSVEWSDPGEAGNYSSAAAIEINSAAARDLSVSGLPWDAQGDVAGAFESAGELIEREYRSDFMYHAQMEPLNAVVWVKDDGQSADVWAGTQSPPQTINAVARTLDIDASRVRLNRNFLGGGFGRRTVYSMDYVTDAAWLSKATGAPVKVVWTREDDFSQGHYRPISAQYLRASLDTDGSVTGWHHRVASEEPLDRFEPELTKAYGGAPVTAMLGSEHYDHARQPVDFAYDLPNRLVEHIRVPTPMRIYAMRGVGGMPNRFGMESFIDELAEVRQVDPLLFRKQLVGQSDRAQRVLDTVAEMAAWTPGKKGLGLAYSHYADSPAACVVAVSLDSEGKGVRVEEVWLAADIGIVVQPDVAQSQLEGGVIFGLSNALHEELVVEQGRAVQSNFDRYQLMRMAAVPKISTTLINSGAPPTGVGEVGTVITPAALANAITSLTGKRPRHLPFTKKRLAEILNA